MSWCSRQDGGTEKRKKRVREREPQRGRKGAEALHRKRKRETTREREPEPEREERGEGKRGGLRNYVAGRHLKHSRDLSQTAWLVRRDRDRKRGRDRRERNSSRKRRGYLIRATGRTSPSQTCSPLEPEVSLLHRQQLSIASERSREPKKKKKEM